jgi:uncharacterized membrane-anchored protein
MTMSSFEEERNYWSGQAEKNKRAIYDDLNEKLLGIKSILLIALGGGIVALIIYLLAKTGKRVSQNQEWSSRLLLIGKNVIGKYIFLIILYYLSMALNDFLSKIETSEQSGQSNTA